MADFAFSAARQYGAFLEGNWRMANTFAKRIRSDFDQVLAYGTDGRETLLGLTTDPDPVVACMAATFSLKYNPERSIATLKRISAEPGPIARQASQALERWEAGNWELE